MIFRAYPSQTTCVLGADSFWGSLLIRSMRLGALSQWRSERVQLSKHAAASSSLAGARVCERIVLFNKCDLVPDWGIKV